MLTDYPHFLRSLARQYAAESALLSADAAETERLCDRLLVLAAQCPADDPPSLELLDEVTALLTASRQRIEAGTAIRRALWAHLDTSTF
jgi:hypothetical protein